MGKKNFANCNKKLTLLGRCLSKEKTIYGYCVLILEIIRIDTCFNMQTRCLLWPLKSFCEQTKPLFYAGIARACILIKLQAGLNYTISQSTAVNPCAVYKLSKFELPPNRPQQVSKLSSKLVIFLYFHIISLFARWLILEYLERD